ncbi:MAG: SDR family oxidoreductase [Kiritimatiellae bacterium]|nr:SDR family oxidoreductase [Kiritimatiellia bacterium]
MDRFLNLKSGMTVSRAFTIDAGAVDAYAQLTGDANPIHMDAGYARSAGFRDRVVHGMYLAGLVSKIVGEDLPGSGAVWFAQELSFREPVYVGETITITVRLAHVSAAARALTIEVTGSDRHGIERFNGKGKITMPKTRKTSDVTERRALVTGGSGAIGAAICVALARAGFHVLVGYRKGLARARSVAARVRSEGRNAAPVCLNLAAPSAIRRAVSAARKRHGEIDTVVCCAMGRWRRAAFTDLTAADYAEDYAVCVSGHATLLQGLLPRMASARFGRVVGVASSVVHGLPPPGQASYVAAKYGLVGLFRALTAECAGSGITFNLVSPSLVDTPFAAGLPDRARRAMVVQAPLGRLCEARDVADTVELLTRRDCYINGANIPVSGGLVVG